MEYLIDQYLREARGLRNKLTRGKQILKRKESRTIFLSGRSKTGIVREENQVDREKELRGFKLDDLHFISK